MFTISNVDEAIFYQIESATKYTIVTVATDNFTIIANSQEESNQFKQEIGSHFELVNLGSIHWLLGMHITRDWEKHTISIGQSAYIDQIVKPFGIEEMTPFAMPMEANLDLNPDLPSVSTKPATPCKKHSTVNSWAPSCTLQLDLTLKSVIQSQHSLNLWRNHAQLT